MNWQELARRVRLEVRVLQLARADPRTPRIAKWLLAATAAYALSPIDLIPDFIPVLGHLDDAVVVPAGLWLAMRLIPGPVLQESRARALLESNAT